MLCVREHVYGAGAEDVPAALLEEAQVARKRFRVAGDVNRALRRGSVETCEELFTRALARGVEEDDVKALAGVCRALKRLARVAAGEDRVFNPIHARVVPCVSDGVRRELHARDAFGLFRRRERDRADAAVGVEHRLFAREARVLERERVELFRLHRVHLIKRAGRDLKAAAAQLVRQKALTEQDLFRVAQNGARLAGVDVLHDGDDVRAGLRDRLREVAAAGEDGLRRHDREGDLPRFHAAPRDHVAQKAGLAVLVPRREVTIRRRFGGLLQNLCEPGVLQQAVRDRDKAVAPGGIDARCKAAAVRQGGKAQNGLVAVVVRRFHADDRLCDAKGRQQLVDARLLLQKLRFIGCREQRAAAAALCGVETVFHGVSFQPR